MYNEAKKREYIAFKNGDNIFEQNMINWFNKAQSFEEKAQKDLSELPISDIVNLYRTHIHTASDTYLEWIHRSFRDYANWNNPNNNHFTEISREMLTMCVNKDAARSRIIMREDLIRELDGTFLNAMERCLLLGLFEGLLLTDFDELEEKHIDGNAVHLTKRCKHLTVSPKLIEYMVQSARTYTLIPYTDNPKYTIPKYLNLDPSDARVIKMMEAYPRSDRMMRYRNIIKRCKEISGQEWVNAAELPQSGAASMLLDYYRKEKRKIEDVARDHTEELRERYGVGWRYDVLFREKYGYIYK